MTLTSPATSSTSSKTATATLGLGVAAMLLTTTLAFISLGLGAAALITGPQSVRRHGMSAAAVAGMTAAAGSIYIIVLEIFVVG